MKLTFFLSFLEDSCVPGKRELDIRAKPVVPGGVASKGVAGGEFLRPALYLRYRAETMFILAAISGYQGQSTSLPSSLASKLTSSSLRVLFLLPQMETLPGQFTPLRSRLYNDVISDSRSTHRDDLTWLKVSFVVLSAFVSPIDASAPSSSLFCTVPDEAAHHRQGDPVG